MSDTVSPDAPIRAWHFTGGNKLRDGREVRAGDVIVHDGPLVICESGLHASRRAIDALQYAPGSTVWAVDCWGEVIEQRDKLVCTHRRHVASVEGEPLLRSFARWAALQVSRLWDAPEVVMQYLETGDESLRAAAWAAARDAARAAAWAAAEAAAWAAARAAAGAAAEAAAEAAARDAAQAAQNAELERLLREALGVETEE